MLFLGLLTSPPCVRTLVGMNYLLRPNHKLTFTFRNVIALFSQLARLVWEISSKTAYGGFHSKSTEFLLLWKLIIRKTTVSLVSGHYWMSCIWSMWCLQQQNLYLFLLYIWRIMEKTILFEDAPETFLISNSGVYLAFEFSFKITWFIGFALPIPAGYSYSSSF